MSDMKWWGWGAPDVAFSDADKPALAPFLQRYLAVDPARPPSGPVPLSALTIPDPVLVPRLRAALEDDAVVIPFGGGTSISGSLEAVADETRSVISVDLERLDRVLDIDPGSRLARVQAGVRGPALEEQLAARGW